LIINVSLESIKLRINGWSASTRCQKASVTVFSDFREKQSPRQRFLASCFDKNTSLNRLIGMSKVCDKIKYK